MCIFIDSHELYFGYCETSIQNSGNYRSQWYIQQMCIYQYDIKEIKFYNYHIYYGKKDHEITPYQINLSF